MNLAWNTKRLLAAPAAQKVEYHLLSARRLRDGAIISPDPDHSSAGEWVVCDGMYTVSVLTRPTYALPQQLCLSFIPDQPCPAWTSRAQALSNP
jgi:hypothetical protein